VTRIRALFFALVFGVAAASWVLTCMAWRYEEVAEGVAPLDPRRFPALTLVTIGTGGSYENPSRLGPSTAVGFGERVWLVDAGRGVAEALRGASIPVHQPDTVLLTSLLPENTVGLDDLLETGWLGGRQTPLRLVGPPGTRELAASLRARAAVGAGPQARALGLPEAGGEIAVQEVEADFREEAEDLVAAASVLPGGPTPGLAWRFERRGRSAVVAGPGWAPDALVEHARGADLLVHEAVFVPTAETAAQLGVEAPDQRLRREAALHTSLDAVGVLARRAGVGTLVLVRLRPPPVYELQLTSRVDDDFDGRIVVADDGDEFVP